MQKIRAPFFLLAVVVMLAIVLIERSAVQAAEVAARLPPFISGRGPSSLDQALQIFTPEQQRVLDRLRSEKAGEISQLTRADLSGFGVRSLQFVDGLLLFTLALMTLALLLPKVFSRYEYLHAKAQGIVTLIFDILLILAAIVFALIVLAKLISMVLLFLSFPFGTLAYLIIFGSFPRGAMIAVLSLIFVLKVIFGVLMLLAHQDFLKNLGLVVYVLGAFVANLIVTFLYGIVPGVLVSITDAIAALVVVILGVILALFMLVGSIISIVFALKPA
jgi:hypothetical protein